MATSSSQQQNGKLRQRKTAVKLVRTTVILPEVLDRNVEVFSAKESLTKNAAFQRLLSFGLSSKGYSPDKTPKVTVSY